MSTGAVMENCSIPEWEIFHSGDSLVIVQVYGRDRKHANQTARAFAKRIVSANLPFICDVVPGMTSVGVHYSPRKVAVAAGMLPHHVIETLLGQLLVDSGSVSQDQPRTVDIPVCYGGEYGPDLVEVAVACGISVEEVIRLHCHAVIEVMMIGFAPGHPYMGMLDKRLAIPRRETPRTAVLPGTIGIANGQSVIYPMTLPSGWNLIGRTPLQIFEPRRAEPCLLRPGDQIRFVPISQAEFDERAQAGEER